MEAKSEYEPEKGSYNIGEGEVRPTSDYGADTELQRLLSTRHVTMIALGSSIGMGLWLGSGKSLASGGPAGIFLGYILAGSMIWSVSHSIGEMAVMYPLPSAFVQWVSLVADSFEAPRFSLTGTRLENSSALLLPSLLDGHIGSRTASPSLTNSKPSLPL